MSSPAVPDRPSTCPSGTCKPTLIGQPSLFEAWVTEQDERRTHSRGHLIQNGVVTVEAVGEFVNMERARIAALHRRDGKRRSMGRGGRPPIAS